MGGCGGWGGGEAGRFRVEGVGFREVVGLGFRV